MWRVLATLVLLAPCAASALTINNTPAIAVLPNLLGNTLAAVPYVGWDTYYSGIIVTDTNVETISDYFATGSGLQAAMAKPGEPFIMMMEGGWNQEDGSQNIVRDGSNNPQINATTFPSGLTAVLAHFVANGQLGGLYRTGGTTGCFAGNWPPDNFLNHDVTYFMTTFGAKVFKLDGCGIEPAAGAIPSGSERDIYASLAVAAQATGLGNLMLVGDSLDGEQTWANASSVAGSYRLTGDIAGISGSGCSFNSIQSHVQQISRHPGVVYPYHFPDADYLLGGCDGTDATAISQMEMYAIATSPFVMGSDPRTLTTAVVTALEACGVFSTCPKSDLVQLNQDPWVSGARHLLTVNNGNSTYGSVLGKRLSTAGSRAFVFSNGDTGSPHTLLIDPAQMGIDSTQPYTYTNLLTGTIVTGHTGTISSGSLPIHGSVLFVLTGGTENPVTCWSVNPGGTGQPSQGYTGGCASQADNNNNSMNDPFGSVGGGIPVDGTNVSTSTTITGIPDPTAQQGCYQKQRKGIIQQVIGDDPHSAGFEFVAENLTVGANYTYYVDFAEIEGNTTGQRLMNMDINVGDAVGPTHVLTNYDIFAAAGGANKAVVVTGTAKAEKGYISFDFNSITPPTGVPTVGCILVIKQ